MGCTSQHGLGQGWRGGAPAVARLRAALLRTALAQADRVVCVARSQQDSLRRILGFSDKRLPVVHSGVDPAFWTPAAETRAQVTHRDLGPHTSDFGLRTSDFRAVEGYVLAAGRDLGRDYGTLLAASTGIGREVRIVAGPANVAGMEIPAHVRVECNLSPVELLERYRGAACVVVPTHGDGYPRGSDCSGTLVMLDAMACAKPVVVTERRSIDDYLSPDSEALTVPPGDPVALRRAVQDLLASPDRARRLGAAGRQAVEERFNTRAMAGKLAQVFFEVAE
jgi:glycosyltransferase involved in cell wall biosynthesis